MEQSIARAILEGLKKAYPTRMWTLEVDCVGGVLILRTPMIPGKGGYIVKMGKLTLHEMTKLVVTAAGHILERHGLSTARRPKNNHDFRDLKPSKIRPGELDYEAHPDAKPELNHGIR